MNALAASSVAVANPLALPSGPCRRRRTLRVKSPRLALVEARPGPPVPVIRDGTAENDTDNAAALVLRTATGEVYPAPFSRDRTEDIQAEARAMARAVNASVYSPELLAAKYNSRPIKVLRRALEIFTGLGSFALNLWLDQLNGLADRNKRLRAIQLRQTFTRLGPTFVKIGQGLSTRPDLCPTEYLEELSELQVIRSLSYFEYSIGVIQRLDLICPPNNYIGATLFALSFALHEFSSSVEPSRLDALPASILFKASRTSLLQDVLSSHTLSSLPT